jgi:leucyl-tRNA synthetase
MKEDADGNWLPNGSVGDAIPSPALNKSLHATIKKVTEDLEGLQFNTAISALMVLTNELTPLETRPRRVVETLVLLLAPFAPHMAEELWSVLGHGTSLSHQPWPVHDPSALIEDELEIIIQFNGKLRGRMRVAATLPQSAYEAQVRSQSDFPAWLDGKIVRKVIVVPGKLVNMVTG